MVEFAVRGGQYGQYRPNVPTPEELQSKIRSEHLIKKGDRVEIHTADSRTYGFYVGSVDDEEITGWIVKSGSTDHFIIEINDIVALKTKEFSGGKTVLLADGMAVGALGILYIGLAIGLIGLGFWRKSQYWKGAHLMSGLS